MSGTGTRARPQVRSGPNLSVPITNLVTFRRRAANFTYSGRHAANFCLLRTETQGIYLLSSRHTPNLLTSDSLHAVFRAKQVDLGFPLRIHLLKGRHFIRFSHFGSLAHLLKGRHFAKSHSPAEGQALFTRRRLPHRISLTSGFPLTFSPSFSPDFSFTIYLLFRLVVEIYLLLGGVSTVSLLMSGGGAGPLRPPRKVYAPSPRADAPIRVRGR
jgi:hypothetical protein